MVQQSSLPSWSCGPHDLQTEVIVEQSSYLSWSCGLHDLETDKKMYFAHY
jgi:hypothetical protein